MNASGGIAGASRGRLRAARLCALLMISAILSGIGAAPAAAAALTCDVTEGSAGTTITWNGVPEGTQKLVIERRVSDTWHRREAVDPAATLFVDDSTPAEYRVLARGTWPTVLDQADCAGTDAPIDSFSCVVSTTSAGFRIEWPAVNNAEFIVRRQVTDGGTFWWRARISDTSYDDAPSPTGEANYRVEVLTSSGRRSADCSTDDVPVQQCVVTAIAPEVNNAEFDQPVIVGGDGAAYFAGSTANVSGSGIYRIAPNALSAEKLAVPGDPESVRDLVVGPEGHVYFFGTVSQSNRLYRFNVGTQKVERRSLAPGYGWSYGSDMFLGSDGRIYWAARFGDFPSRNYGLLAHDPATDKTERVFEDLGGPIDRLVNAPDRLYFSWAPIIGFESLNGNITGPREVRYLDLESGEVNTPATPTEAWRFPQYSLLGPDGRIYLSSGPDGGYDPATDATFSVPDLGFDAIFGDDGFIYSRSDGAIQQLNPATNELRRFDPPPGVANWNPFDLAFVDGAVYALNNFNRQEGLFKLDPVSGLTSEVVPLTSRITPSIGGGSDGRVFFFASVEEDGRPRRLLAVDSDCS